jgi:hypothetical protein
MPQELLIARTSAALACASLLSPPSLAGCTQPIRGADTGRDVATFDTPADAPAADGARLDGPGLDGPSFDGPRLDGPSFDGPSLDGPRLDTPSPTDTPIDIGSDATRDALSLCDMLYGSLPGYVLCTEATDSCRFAVALGGALSDCRSVCETDPAWDCDRAERPAGAGVCSFGGSRACGAGGNPVICTCMLR